MIIACAGGGSNFAGLTFPFVGRKLRGEANYRVIAAEPEAAPSLTRGVYAYDFGDTGHMAPIVKMHTLGSEFIPEPIHAGGLRYHGMAPLVSLLKEHGVIDAQSVHQRAAFEVGVQFARTEGILPAPESTHAIKVAVDEALAGQGGRRVAGHPVQPVGPRPLRPGRVRGATSRAGSRTTSTRRRRSRPRSPTFPTSADRRTRGTRPAASPPALGSSRAQARLPRLWPPDLHGRRRWRRCSPRSGDVRAVAPTWTPSGASSTAAPGSAARTRPTIPARPPTRASGGRVSAA